MKLSFLFLSWRDIKSPKSGGAEVHTHELLKKISEKHNVIHFSPRYKGLDEHEVIDGITYIRKGGIFSVIFHAKSYYRKNRNAIDYVVDQCNTHRFFTRFWVPAKKRIFFIHQLTREIWYINLKFPFSVIGDKLETWLLRLQKDDNVIALSESTKQDLIDVGFNEDKIFIIPIAVSKDILGLGLASDIDSKKHDFIYVGRYSKYKGIDAAVKALGIVRKKYPDAKLRIVGKEDKNIIDTVIAPCAAENSFSYGSDEEKDDLILCGFVSEEEKFEMMKNSLALLFPSVREGWGIIVTESAALGTPSIVYDNPGCRDAVDYGKAGYLCSQNSSEELARLMMSCIDDTEEYLRVRKDAYDFAQRFSWEHNAELFDEFVNRLR